ncbi:type 2 isopentenyl-diphosphate Delta-isomerase [Lacticaseibacillus casei]|jgi:isopentenyl-diphosphate delta-isomerase|uniref:Isopentenyl-diphosphate delta-isomerase n=1 Tax=Lacticaseibacillus huelsenbergensis TaxID=3035291 RepID=A0ABY8DPT0_9LACO|nr:MULTISPECIES: type 2 isopentenyl-diphosphate Delta-isomerase [Lacticaseibacillus]MDG3060743.1 type 2 isopentenyl-diphosphate Delta-isomerase [Lacticaseibacillus sp. BCRC 81376]QVI37749.1 type 2 isopentenyl-diphosphate Delta-isomerase [Lacticaseibacillus casei]QXG59541.1 type 2 isopentenyl-diphosphate Delta-isomerase [Lacticaseibacillus casei]WFB38998.1 type 2 isopentenyl-diphosphate Delta-isomerase [Lacticaseibacillus huelsenbergensis]WFB40700.1 type 2 isopentenyl-diphosphate Delta-isomeras
MTQSQQSHRKDEHVFLAEKYFKADANAGFDQIRLLHRALPETALADVDLTPPLPFGWRWPIYINAMTGGSPQTGKLNAQLGQLANALDVAIASGSQSVALHDPELSSTFTTLRQHNPDGFIFANIGAGHDVHEAKKAVAMLHANALEVHLNAAQEVVMPEGDRDFLWQDNIQAIAAGVSVPVVAKEVGNGFIREDLQTLQQLGIRYVDLGGRGGTNFAVIENARRPQQDFAYMRDWGQTTAESLLEARGLPLTILATGGVRSPLDVVKAQRLGAHAVGISGLVLHHLIQTGYTATLAYFQEFLHQIRQLYALLGVTNWQALQIAPALLGTELEHYRRARNLPAI